MADSNIDQGDVGDTTQNAFEVVRKKEIPYNGEIAELVLETNVSDFDFPGHRVYTMHLRTPGLSTMLVTSPSAYILSRAAYETIFDAIETGDAFDKLSDSLSSHLHNSHNSIQKMLEGCRVIDISNGEKLLE